MTLTVLAASNLPENSEEKSTRHKKNAIFSKNQFK